MAQALILVPIAPGPTNRAFSGSPPAKQQCEQAASMRDSTNISFRGLEFRLGSRHCLSTARPWQLPAAEHLAPAQEPQAPPATVCPRAHGDVGADYTRTLEAHVGAAMMKGKGTLNVAATGLIAGTILTSLPQQVLELIVSHLRGDDKSRLTVCCKATLPILCMGHVRVRTSSQDCERPLYRAIPCLMAQPGGVSHLEVSSRGVKSGCDCLKADHLVDLSVMFNLRKLTLDRVNFALPALQLVATRLHELKVYGCHLQGSADGFLTKGWTALTSLSLTQSRMDEIILTAGLALPALEDVRIRRFMGHQGGELQLDQLTGSCSKVSRLEFQLGNCFRQATETSKQRCRLLNLSRLADLQLMSWPLHSIMDLDLPPSLTQLRFGGPGIGGSKSVDLFWVLLEAVKCVRQGAQLHKLICDCAVASLQPAQWGASLDEQYRRLGGQLCGLRELEVWGGQEQMLSALGAVASAAPSLFRLEIVITGLLTQVQVSPICSASLKSISVEWAHCYNPMREPSQVLLTLLPGCARLQKVAVRGKPSEGAAVKIRCHRCSVRCIVPVDGYASSCDKVPEEVHAGSQSDMIVKFLHMPSSEQGVQECTVLYACHAAGPGQAPLWGYDVVPGIL